jgi:DNA-binding MarR family transcriptional regulator
MIVQFDERILLWRIAPMPDGLVLEVQRLYPQIYLACHVDHVRAASTKWRVSARDSSILSHLSVRVGISPRRLAGHLGVVPSTLSAAIKRLEKFGYIRNLRREDDRRRRELWLTERGVQAMMSTSVLDAGRIQEVLHQLSRAEREEAIRGLSLLARAARALKEKQ